MRDIKSHSRNRPSRIWQNVALAIIEDHQGNILLVKREGPEYSGYWGLPGGKFWFGEGGSSAVLREIGEETGLKESDLDVPIFAGMALERLEVSHNESTAGSLRARWQLYYYRTKILSRGSSSLSSNARWFTEQQIRSSKNVIPSLPVVIALAKDLRRSRLDFFFMEDTVLRIPNSLKLIELQLQAYKKISYEINNSIYCSVAEVAGRK